MYKTEVTITKLYHARNKDLRILEKQGKQNVEKNFIQKILLSFYNKNISSTTRYYLPTYHYLNIVSSVNL